MPLTKPEKVAEAVRDSVSYAGVLRRLGLPATGYYYAVLKTYIARHRLDTSHFRGKGWRKGTGALGDRTP
ncbi:hypothetical protein ACFODL_15635 [Phenylobacterium terrae]|uniref:Uncharacterized protein n=1 Tax=Phenylobacterium terrae TaxID=2665495 RepID=A0ABW4N7Y3_9CAUL